MRWLPWWLLLLMMFATGHIAYNSTASEPVGLYWIKGTTMAQRNDLVLLKEPLKRLVGVPGDTIETSPMGTWVNGEYIPKSGIPKHSPYEPYRYRQIFVLEDDQYWVLGDHPLSYDSRYIGPIPGSLIHSTVDPVWTK